MRAPAAGIDQERIVSAVREIIDAIGEDGGREGLLRTPERIAQMYAELFSGLFEDPLSVLATGFQESHKEMVVLKNIPFYSLCEHHFLPFHGQAHVGYVPEGRIVGVSQIARTLMEGLSPDGVAVVIEAEHLCLTMRGAQKPGTIMITSAIRGGFRRRGVTRAEFLSLVQGR